MGRIRRSRRSCQQLPSDRGADTDCAAPKRVGWLAGWRGGRRLARVDGRVFYPFIATTDLVAALVRPPEVELPGVRVVRPPIFDTTLERRDRDAPTVTIGDVLDRHLRPAGKLEIPLDTINRHTFVCGATGSGKSQTVRGLLEGLSRPPLGIPWLCIEPAKAEYARMAGRLDGVSDVLVIAPGDRHAPPGVSTRSSQHRSSPGIRSGPTHYRATPIWCGLFSWPRSRPRSPSHRCSPGH